VSPGVDASAAAALVPCHREPPAEALLRRLVAQVPRVTFVGDGMPPQAARALEQLAGALQLEVLHLGRHSGKGHAIATGIQSLRASESPPEGVLIVDADGQHPPEAIPRFLAASAEADLVIGNRFGGLDGHMPPVRRFSNRFSSRLVSLTTNVRVPDSQCGMRLLHGRALTEIEFPCGGMDSETRHLRRCLRAGVRVTWVAIPAIYGGPPSSFRPVRDSVAVLRAAVERQA
jgi:glycosyltransferase involved in cell wall biosynthesis